MTTDPLLGTTIERYQLDRVLGEGGMGRVYLAVQPAIGSRVAIKVLSEECSRNAELLERFFAEARAVNLIRHENMIHVEVGAREVTATVRTTEDCDDKLVRHPTCHFAGVWKQALANRTPKDVVSRIGWLFDEKWFFDVDLEGKGGGVSTFVDRCQ